MLAVALCLPHLRRWPPLTLLVIGAMLCGLALNGPALARNAMSPGAAARGRWLLPGLLIMLAAGALRLVALESYPAWLDYDSVQNGWIGLTLLEQPGYTPILTRWALGNETSFFYLLGGCLLQFDLSIASLRLPAAVIGLLTVLLIYLLATELFDWRVGLAASALAALTPWHIALSRMATQPILAPFWIAAALLLLARGLRRESWVELAACGLCIGAGLHSYEAFRIFPLAVAAALLAVRWQDRRFRRGLAELSLVATMAALVALPVLYVALTDWPRYAGHLSINSIHHTVQAQGSLAPAAKNLLLTVAYWLVYFPQDYTRPGRPISMLALQAPLFIWGLAALLRRPTASHRARWLLLATTLVMAAPFVFARFAPFAPRRYTGEFIPIVLLAGAALVGILERITASLTRPHCAALLLALLALTGIDLASLFSRLSDARELPIAFETEALMRRALQEAQTGSVLLEPGVGGNSYLTRLFLKHPRIRRLPTAWPLPADPLEPKVIFLGGGQGHGDALTALYHVRAERVWLRLSNGRRHACARYMVDRARILALRAPPGAPSLRLVQRDGRYAGKPVAAGLHPTDPSLPHTPGLHWKLAVGALRRTPEAIRPSTTFRRASLHVLTAAPTHQHNRGLQDAVGAGRGAWIADLDRDPVKAWQPSAGPTGRTVLWRDGKALTRGERYLPAVPKALSLAVSPSRTFLLDRRVQRILVFDRRGRHLGEAVGGLTDPVDIAVHGQCLYIADPGRGALLLRSAPGLPHRTLIEGITPVSVATAPDGTLAYLDRRRHQLVWGKTRINLGHVGRDMRLSISTDGRAALVDPDDGRVRLFDAGGRLLAPGGDPALIDRLIGPEISAPVAALWLRQPTRLVLIGLRGAVIVLEQTADPEQLPGQTLEAAGFVTGNLNRSGKHDFGSGLVIDGGARPAHAVYAFALPRATTCQIWVQLATQRPRPLTLHLDDRLVGAAQAIRTGGFSRRHLAWYCLASTRISAGRHRLRLQTSGLFPHIARIRIVTR